MEKFKNVLKAVFEVFAMLLIILVFAFIISAIFSIYSRIAHFFGEGVTLGVFTLLNFAIFIIIILIGAKK